VAVDVSSDDNVAVDLECVARLAAVVVERVNELKGRRDAPDADVGIGGARDEGVAVEVDGEDVALVGVQLMMDMLVVRKRAQPDRSVARARRDVGLGDGETENAALVLFEKVDRVACRGVKDP
jgi:hypothetical protein